MLASCEVVWLCAARVEETQRSLTSYPESFKLQVVCNEQDERT